MSTLLTDTTDTPSAAQTAQPSVAAADGAPAAPSGTAANGDWRATLPEDLREHPSLKNASSPETLAKNYVNLEKLLGGEKVPVPKDENDQDGWDRLYKAAGRPDTPDAYEIEAPKLPESIPYDPEGETYYKKLVHQHGLNQRQAAGLWDALVKFETEKAAAGVVDPVQARNEAVSALQREWGTAYQARLGNMRKGMAAYADDDFRGWLDQTGLGNDVRMIKTFERIGREIGGETKLKDGAPRGGAKSLDDTISAFRKKHEAALMDHGHPEHQRRTEEMVALYTQRHS